MLKSSRTLVTNTGVACAGRFKSRLSKLHRDAQGCHEQREGVTLVGSIWQCVNALGLLAQQWHVMKPKSPSTQNVQNRGPLSAMAQLKPTIDPGSRSCHEYFILDLSCSCGLRQGRSDNRRRSKPNQPHPKPTRTLGKSSQWAGMREFPLSKHCIGLGRCTWSKQQVCRSGPVRRQLGSRVDLGKRWPLLNPWPLLGKSVKSLKTSWSPRLGKCSTRGCFHVLLLLTMFNLRVNPHGNPQSASGSSHRSCDQRD